MQVSTASNRLKLFIIIGYIAIIFVFFLAFIVSDLSAKIDTRRNIKNYTAIRVGGFSMKNICTLIAVKNTVLQLVAITVSVPVSVVILKKINEYFYANESMGGLIVKLTFGAVMLCCLLSFAEILVTLIRFYISENQIKNVFISQEQQN